MTITMPYYGYLSQLLIECEGILRCLLSLILNGIKVCRFYTKLVKQPLKYQIYVVINAIP